MDPKTTIIDNKDREDINGPLTRYVKFRDARAPGTFFPASAG